MHQQIIATYIINSRELQVVKCYPHGTDDRYINADAFYDLYLDGQCINLGEPWHDDGEGAPSKEEICEVFFS